MTRAKAAAAVDFDEIETEQEPAVQVLSKREKFVRNATRRSRNAIHSIEVIGTMGGNKSYYDYDNSDVEEIVGALREAVDLMEMRLGRKPRQINLFELKRASRGY